MSKALCTEPGAEQAKKQLGKLIKELRGELSMRQLAAAVELSPSNMMYIENGTNAPTAEVYHKLVSALHPNSKTRAEMDQLYMTIRKVPPPDICELILENTDLIDALRQTQGKALTQTQTEGLKALLASFALENKEGESEDGQAI